MKNNGEVLYGNGQAREVVKQFRKLATRKTTGYGIVSENFLYERIMQKICNFIRTC